MTTYIRKEPFMKEIFRLMLFTLVIALLPTRLASAALETTEDELYKKRPGTQTRWINFENPTGAKGEGGKENQGGKGHAFDILKAGQTRVLLNVQGSGIIQKMWVTFRERDPEMLQSLKLEMFWEDAPRPAVSVPFGDFVGAISGQPVAFESELFSNPEGRSFNCYIPMPFCRAAKITITNESARDVQKLFYQIDYVFTEHESDILYFHACWRRERWTKVGRDFEILPRVRGEGRYLGTHLGVVVKEDNVGWWGEGEVKIYLDGDTEYPTLAGTGTEDYIGTGWGQGTYQNRYQGSLVADHDKGLFSFYRYHIPDIVYFHKDCRVTIQQMGGSSRSNVLEMMKKGVSIKPVSLDGQGKFIKLLEPDTPGAEDEAYPSNMWTNYFREDDFAAVAFFYLDSPENGLPQLAPVEKRIEALPTPHSDRKAISLEPGILEQYVGEYEIQPGIVLTITREDGRLFSHVTGQQRIEIFAQSAADFFVKGANVQITFVKNETEEVVQAIINYDGTEMAGIKAK